MRLGARRIIVVVLIVLAVAGVRTRLHAQELTVSEALANAGVYMDTFNTDLSSIVAEERYVQIWRRPKSKERGPGDEVTRRELLSDLMLVRPAAGSDWVQYRDVFDVDGVPVRDRVERLTKLFMAPSASTEAQIARIQAESARHNLGNIERNLNTPVFALQFLTTANQPRFKFKRTDERKSAAAANTAAPETGAFRVSTEIWVMQFEEVARPTIVHTADDKDVPARGRFWIEAQSGRVLMSELIVGDRQRQGTITVSYQSEPLLGLLVPIEMREQYEERRTKSRIEGAASYGRFRQFQVQVDEQLQPPAAEAPEPD